MNGYQGQILASDQPNKYFKAGEEIFSKIKNQCVVPIDYLQSIGIQARPDTEIILNNQLILIGEYGVLQLNNVRIKSIKFNHDTDSFVKIDYIIHEK